MAANGLLETRAHIPDVGGRPQMAGLFALFRRIPVASALLITAFDVEFVALIGMVVKTAERGAQPDLVAWFVVATLAAGALTMLGWWRIAGFNRPGNWREMRLVWLPIVALLPIPFLAGFHLLNPAAGVYILLIYVLVAFREEALYRGVILHILNPKGRRRAVFITSLLFGVSSAASLLLFHAADILPRVAGAFCFGILLGALRLRTNTIWIPIILNVLIGLTLRFSPWYSVYLNAVLPILMLGYGLFLLRDRRALEPEPLVGLRPVGKRTNNRRAMIL
jgi:uncharacterized protein